MYFNLSPTGNLWCKTFQASNCESVSTLDFQTCALILIHLFILNLHFHLWLRRGRIDQWGKELKYAFLSGRWLKWDVENHFQSLKKLHSHGVQILMDNSRGTSDCTNMINGLYLLSRENWFLIFSHEAHSKVLKS